jgi:hypothetical protein
MSQHLHMSHMRVRNYKQVADAIHDYYAARFGFCYNIRQIVMPKASLHGWQLDILISLRVKLHIKRICTLFLKC